jgi:phosphatidylglycerophosphatase A
MGRVKESSDELNPLASVAGTTLIAKRARSLTGKDYGALAFSTWGVGFIPFAPGTFGSAAGLGLYLLLRAGTLGIVYSFAPDYSLTYESVESLRVMLMLAVIILITALGIWAASRAEKILARKDPGVVVVDEVAGQLITFLFIPLGGRLSWWMLLAGFVLFRLFDIWKPYPIRRLESLESGLGIMADDILAGVYAAAALTLLLTAIEYVKIIF